MNQETVQTQPAPKQIHMDVHGGTVKLNIISDSAGAKVETVKRMLLGDLAKV